MLSSLRGRVVDRLHRRYVHETLTEPDFAAFERLMVASFKAGVEYGSGVDISDDEAMVAFKATFTLAYGEQP